MPVLNDFLNFHVISWLEVLLRIFLAALFGVVLGWDREKKDKPIDYRAFMIVCITSCIVAILGQELYDDYVRADGMPSLDFGKIISGVLLGIGFLGAGAIINRNGSHVVGTATGASIWASGGIGLALGFGFYGLALIALAAVAAILVIGGWLTPRREKDVNGVDSL